ncbi:hypothetical protein [Silanimonas sp.]|jgi:hypothetical protein|uniref:hypothetical protein n=1 Tax=Silanimonas sp. TaxID=1929290 RepID=UPI0037C76EEF
MPIDYRLVYPADAVEQAVPIGALTNPALDPRAAAYASRVARACERAGISNAAVVAVASVAVVRMAMRYGPLGKDGHAYHNQDHLLELLEDKLPALLAQAGLTTGGREALALFCACHDLRQREARRHDHEPIGANEAASLAETERLLDAAGLSGNTLRMMLRFAIVGSTFAAGNDENVQSQGAFAHRLAGWMDGSQPGWRDDPIAAEAEHLARMAADIDTSNVASPYIDFAQSAVALATEIQYRAGRALDAAESAAGCLGFLTEGQERYVFALQRFASREGRAAFGAQRDANAARVRETGRRLRERFPAGSTPSSGHAVINAFREIAAQAP